MSSRSRSGTSVVLLGTLLPFATSPLPAAEVHGASVAARAPLPPAASALASLEDGSRPRRATSGAAQAPPGPKAVAAGCFPYDVVTVPPLPGKTRSRAYGINASGQVAGRAANYDPVAAMETERQGFVWDSVLGSRPLPTLSGQSGVWGIDDSGRVSGHGFLASGFEHATRWTTATDPFGVTDLGTLANLTTGTHGDKSSAWAINASGKVVGRSDIPNDSGTFTPFHAILWDDATGLHDLGTLENGFPEFQNGYSVAYDLNGAGQVVGTASNATGGWHYLAFSYTPGGGMQPLQRDPTWSDVYRQWNGITVNEAGLIGGSVAVSAGHSLPYYWPNAASAPVPLVVSNQFPWAEIYGVNASGTMVGVMWDTPGTDRAFVWTPVIGMRNLNELVDPALGWTLEFALGINDAGQISGSGTLNGEPRGFVLMPNGTLPPPPAAGNTGPYCVGESVALSAATVAGATYSWTGPLGFTSSLQNPTIPNATMEMTGPYRVTVTLAGGTCASVGGTTNVVVNQPPSPPSITAPPYVGPGESFTASVVNAPAMEYVWTVTNGTVTAGLGTSMLTVTAGQTGPVSFSMTETDLTTGCVADPSTLSIPVGLPATQFYTVAPCRLFDTRLDTGPEAAAPALAPGETRVFSVSGRCGLTATSARALSVNQTITSPTDDGELVLYRGDVQVTPNTGNVSYRAGKTRANNALLELSRNNDGTFIVHNRSNGTVDLILDVNGSFH